MTHEYIGFTVEYENFPVTTITTRYDDNFEYCFGVWLKYCRSQDFNQYTRWCYKRFGAAGYEEDGMGSTIWFKEEKHRTMFMLKWS